jgi:ankyrin repeat protein
MNLRENKLRYFRIRQKFTEEDINDFLIRVKMGQILPVYKKLLSRPELVNVSDSLGRTPLHWAVLRGHLSTIRVLLYFKPNLTHSNVIGSLQYEKDIFNQTPLDLAFSNLE